MHANHAAVTPEKPDTDVFYTTTWAIGQLVQLATHLHAGAMRMERARVAGDFAGMRSAHLDLTGIVHDGRHITLNDLGFQADAMTVSVGRALEIYAKQQEQRS